MTNRQGPNGPPQTRRPMMPPPARQAGAGEAIVRPSAARPSAPAQAAPADVAAAPQRRPSERPPLDPPEASPQEQEARPVREERSASPVTAARAQAGGGEKRGFRVPKIGNPFSGMSEKFAGLQGKIPTQYLAIAGIGLIFLVVVAIFGAAAPALMDSSMPSNDQGASWFAAPQNVETGPIFRAPKNLADLIKNPSWFWIVWPLPWVLLYVMLRQDRFHSKEKTDVILVNYGLIFLAVGFLLPTPLAFIINYLAGVLGYALPMSLPTLAGVVTLICVFVHVALQLAASVSGQLDWSPLAIAGLFLVGAVTIWFYPEAAFLSLMGWILIGAGIGLMVREVGRSGQRGNVLVVAVMMPLLFLVSLGFFWYLIGLVGIIVPPVGWPVLAVNALRMVLRVVYALRPLVSALIAMAVTNSGGELLAAVMVNEIYRRVVNDKGDTPIQAMSQEGTARFDARAIGIMLLYLLVPVLIWVFKFFTL